MLKDLLKFTLAYALKSARGKRAARVRMKATRLWDNGDTAGAEQLLRKAIRLDPDSASIASGLGMLVWERGRLDEGIALLRRAVGLDPAFAGARVNLAIALYLNESAEESVAHYREALRLDPGNRAARLNILMPLLETCDWDSAEAEVALLKARGSNSADEAALDCVDPFLSLLVPLPQALRLRIARHHSRKAAMRIAQGPRVRRTPRTADRARLRVGYVSNGFQNGATAHLTAGMFEHHDRARFETFAYSLGIDNGGEYRARLVAAFDHFTDIRPMTHLAAAQRMADDGIDILVDLMGFQADGRPEIAELRPAPVQVSFLGYPGTLGSGAIDFLVADRTVIPEPDAQYYSEKIIWMPDSYQVNDRRQRFADKVALRADNGLPEGFVFCAFNQHSKIERQVFDLWMKILASVPRSVLWLQAGSGARRLRARASQKGVDPTRLIFAPRLPKPEHLARLRLAGLFLDTHTYNAHTTSSDALWAGVPVLTCPSDAFAGRVAASLLNAIGLPELVCADFAGYEKKAIDLARDPASLAAIREKLEACRLTRPLFDTEKYTRHFERALASIWAIHCAGEAPRSFVVDPA
jgi:protein O-GlcNAc transferase